MKVRELVVAIYGLDAEERRRSRGEGEDTDTAGDAISRELLKGGIARLKNYTIDSLLDHL